MQKERKEERKRKRKERKPERERKCCVGGQKPTCEMPQRIWVSFYSEC